ncbi:MAG TPA: TlpA disulfide reductase family protein [Rhodanobacter sp.]|nr:TlpA disulfide reductase family protein [Rhodanobacter sp.]
MAERSRHWLILGLAVLVAAAGAYVQDRGQQVAKADASVIGRHLPALILNDLDGLPHRLNDYRGRRVLLNFWASWCGPCLQEMPALQRAQEKFGDHGVIVVGIGMDSADRVRAFLAEHPVSYPILLGDMRSPSTTRTLGDTSEMLPYSILIDSDGRIIDTHIGILSNRQLGQWLGDTNP